MNQNANQMEYGLINVAHFIIDEQIMVRKNDIEMYSTYNEGKPVIAESFIRTLKNKICKYMT